MSQVITKAIAGAISALILFGIYLFIKFIMNRKNINDKDITYSKKGDITKENVEVKYKKRRISTNILQIRAILFILIGLISFYVATQCDVRIYYQNYNAIFFGSVQVVANELSTQIYGVGNEIQTSISKIMDIFQ